jgi:integrase
MLSMIDSLVAYFETVYRPRRLGQASPSTIEHYRSNLRALAAYLGRVPGVVDLREETLLPFLAHWGSTRSPATVLSVRQKLLALWRYAAARLPGIPEPDLGPFRVPQTNPTAWTPGELGRLLMAARRFRPRTLGPRTYCCVRPDLWWPALLLVLFDTGFRRMATLELRWSDVDLEAGWAIARAMYQKTDRDEVRTLAPDTTAALSAIRWPDREQVFPFGGRFVTFYYHFALILRSAGLPATHRDKTQKIRRTHATWLAVEAGQAAAQESLGHSSLRLTQRSYLDQRFVRPVNAAARLPRPTL